MSADNEQIKAIEKEVVTFIGYGGKVSFIQFGRKIGEGLWMDNLPIIEETGRINNADFKIHCTDILDSIAVSNANRVKILTPDTSPLWKREWQTQWRRDQRERMHDVVSMRCKGQALLSLEESGLANG
jgi:hypothetical protein